MASTAAVLNILVTANTAQATTGLARTNTQLKTTAATANTATAATTKASTGMRALGTAAKWGGAAVVAGLAVGLKKAVDEAREAQKATAQTRAVIKSMGNQAGVTAREVEKLANRISTYAGVDDEAIQSAENLLLTFKNLRNEAGKGNDIFTQTTELAVDMSAALGQDLKSSSIQLGKALNDPSVGLTALRRVGVSFSDTQSEMIKKMFESGKQMKAQKIILAELNREFRGSAKAQADPWDKLNVALENLAESVGSSLLPTFSKWANQVAKFLHQMNTGKKAGGDFGKALKVVGDIIRKVLWPVTVLIYKQLYKMGKALVDVGKWGVKAFDTVKNAAKNLWDWIKGSWQKIGDWLSNPFETAANAIIDFINVIIKAINILPGIPDIGLIGNIGGGPSKQKQQAKKKGGGRQAGGPAWKVPGYGSGDKVHMQAMVEPGEGVFVMNRNAMGAMEAMNKSVPRFAGGGVLDLAKKTPIGKAVGGLGDILGDLPSPSDLPPWVAGVGSWVLDQMKEFIQKKFSSGPGALSPITGKGIVAVGRQLQSRGFLVGEHPAFGGVGQHTSGSLHYSGRAIDVNWPNAAMEPAFLRPLYNQLARTGPTELFFQNRGIPGPVSAHYDHLHLGYKAGGPVKGRGARFVQGGGHWSADEAATLLYQVGASRSQARLLSRKVHGESGGRPGAVGHDPGGSTGLGLWQITTGFNDDLIRKYGGRNAMFDPVNNARAALDILRRQGIGAWYAGSSGAGSIMGKWLLSGEELLAQKSGSFKTQRDAVNYLMKRGVDKATAQSAAIRWMNQHPFGGTGGGKGKKKKKPAAGGGAAAATDDTAADRIAAMNELIGEENLLKLQNYNLGMAQHPMLGLANPARPGLAPLVSPATAGVLAGAAKPSVNSSAKRGKGKVKSHLGISPPAKTRGGAKSHLGVAPVILIEDGAVNANRIRSLSGKEAKRAMKRAARRGNRGLPSGGGRGP